jgi:hypothetical protein
MKFKRTAKRAFRKGLLVLRLDNRPRVLAALIKELDLDEEVNHHVEFCYMNQGLLIYENNYSDLPDVRILPLDKIIKKHTTII